jgi:VanZ family protein
MFEKLYRWRWCIWTAYLLLWSAGLLMPVPRDPWVIGELEGSPRIIFTKGLHFSAYALLSILTAWLRVPSRYRFLLMFLIMCHATLTEALQFTLEFIGRNGNLLDVTIDQAGILLGMLLSWRWWTYRN